jgi:hypothetical protein
MACDTELLQLLHELLKRPCSQIAESLQLLHEILQRLCLHAPPQLLHVLLARPCSQMESATAALASASAAVVLADGGAVATFVQAQASLAAVLADAQTACLNGRLSTLPPWSNMSFSFNPAPLHWSLWKHLVISS